MTPAAVRPTACWRAAGSWARWQSQARSGATAVVGSSPLPPPADSGSSGMVKRGTSPSPARVSSAPYCRDTSAITWCGTRSRTATSDASYCLAVRSRCQGTASAYREAVVTITHTSAAQISSAASLRLRTTSESMSGASSSASPRGSPGEVSTRSEIPSSSSPSSPPSPSRSSHRPGSPDSSGGSQTLVSRGSTRAPANQW